MSIKEKKKSQRRSKRLASENWKSWKKKLTT